MATTRLIPLHIGKGRNTSTAISGIIDYVENPQKTDNGRLITGYKCDSRTVDSDFLLSKRQYTAITGREQGRHDVLAYQIRQSFKPGEIDPEKANRLGYELALAFTKGNHQFIVATHIDKAHIHNHIIFNSTSLDYKKKFRDFLGSAKAMKRLNDRICLENGLSIVENPQRKGVTYDKWLGDKKSVTFRDKLRQTIDSALEQKPKDFDDFLRLMKDAGYNAKRGKHLSFTGAGQQRAIRCDTLKSDYTEQAIRLRIAAPVARSTVIENTPKRNAPKLNLLIDIQSKVLEGKGAGYERWAKTFNLKQMAQTISFLADNNLTDYDKLKEESEAATKRFLELSAEIRVKEKRMAEIAELQKNISTYSRTRDIYVKYRQSGYSKKFSEEHRADIMLHQAAKKEFDKLGLKKLPTINSLKQEYAALLTEKKKLFAPYKETKEKMKTLNSARANADILLGTPGGGKECEKDGLRR